MNVKIVRAKARKQLNSRATGNLEQCFHQLSVSQNQPRVPKSGYWSRGQRHAEPVSMRIDSRNYHDSRREGFCMMPIRSVGRGSQKRPSLHLSEQLRYSWAATLQQQIPRVRGEKKKRIKIGLPSPPTKPPFQT